MKFELLPSLREITIFKVCETLWSRSIDPHRITYCREKCRYKTEKGAAWLEIENEIKANIAGLSLPRSLENEVACLVKPIGVEILKWCEFHCSGSYLGIDIPNEFCWTSQGTIDLKRTAERLVRDENLSQETRYKLACIYCLESDILELCLGYRFKFHRHSRQAVEHDLVAFWNSCGPWEIVLPTKVKLCDYATAFETALARGNILAVKYFLEKLKHAKQNQSVTVAVQKLLLNYHYPPGIYRAFPKKFYSRVLCFLLSLLNVEQQMDVLKRHSSGILECFVNSWPCQSFILKIINLVSDSICPKACTSLLMGIANRAFERHEYYDYPGLFTDVWLELSECCKQEVVRDRHFILLRKLLEIKDAKNIRLILKDIDPVKKKEILYSSCVCDQLIGSDDCDLCELFIRECIPFKEDIAEFKEKLRKLKLPDASDQLISLLDTLIRKHGKRKCIEENCGNSYKKLGAQDEAVHSA